MSDSIDLVCRCGEPHKVEAGRVGEPGRCRKCRAVLAAPGASPHPVPGAGPPLDGPYDVDLLQAAFCGFFVFSWLALFIANFAGSGLRYAALCLAASVAGLVYSTRRRRAA